MPASSSTGEEAAENGFRPGAGGINGGRAGGGRTSARSQGSCAHTHSMGKEKARGPEGVAQPSVAGAGPALQEWNCPWA